LARRPRWLLAARLALAGSLVALGVTLAWRGYDFYRLDLDARVDHPDFRLLRPSGVLGLGYGVVATVLFLTNLLYLLRRLMPHLRVGSMRLWLDVHVVTGLAGALLITFHSAFQLRSPVAMTTAVSLAIVVVTGVIGRFIVALTRRDPADLDEALVALDAALPGAAPEIRTVLADQPVFHAGARPSLAIFLRALPRWRAEAAARRREVLARLERFPGVSDAARRRGRRVAHLAAAEVRAEAAAAFLRSWRSLHRFFALLMIITVGVHIGVAWHYGYRWIF
jgi:hypothetical protein